MLFLCHKPFPSHAFGILKNWRLKTALTQIFSSLKKFLLIKTRLLIPWDHTHSSVTHSYHFLSSDELLKAGLALQLPKKAFHHCFRNQAVVWDFCCLWGVQREDFMLCALWCCCCVDSSSARTCDRLAKKPQNQNTNVEIYSSVEKIVFLLHRTAGPWHLINSEMN